MKSGEVKVFGGGGSELYLSGSGGAGTGIFLGNELSNGIFIEKTNSTKTNLSVVSDSVQMVSSAHRISSREVVRIPSGFTQKSGVADVGNDLLTYNLDYGITRGIFPGFKAAPVSLFGGKRNPALSEYRLVVNEISEADYFRGWDQEASLVRTNSTSKFSTKKEVRAISQENALHLAPHQLVEVIAGNVVNSRGEVLDSNYGRVSIGDSLGHPSGTDLILGYEEGRLKSRRGIGYHFQVSTNSLSSKTSNSRDNFVLSIDKEGALKANIPATSNTGNIPYPNFAEFYSEKTDKIETTYGFRKKEKIPITLRDAESGVLFPASSAVDAIQEEESGATRFTGIRYSNDDNYFEGLGSETAADSESIRVNPTKHHNIYAAAEMLIANTINNVLIPFQNAKCTGYIPGNSINKSFERASETFGLDGEDSAQVNYMAAVSVYPGPPAIDPGGGVLVAGQDFTQEFNENEDRVNIQYSNSFAVSKSEQGDLISTNIDKSKEARKAPGGKSANLNFEGSIEASVGSDNNDQKSIILDAAGSMIAWFGKDKNNRSLVVQTDGDTLFNIGGTNGDQFNEGRFELRVNVNHKGFLGEEVDSVNASDYIISISKNGLVIAGMNPGSPMVIRNDGDIALESTSKLILAGQSVEVREGNRPPRKTYKDPVSTDTPDATIEGVPDQIKCLLDSVGE